MDSLSSDQYVPVLRWKQSEVDALSNLREDVKSRLIPLMELCPSMFIQRKKTKMGDWVEIVQPIEYLLKKLAQLRIALGSNPFYLDMIHMADNRGAYRCDELWNMVSEIDKSGQSDIIPVTGFYDQGISYHNLLKNIIHKYGKGACIRLFIRDLSRPSLNIELDNILKILDLFPKEVDLAIDLQSLNMRSAPFSESIDKLPLPDSWRSVTFLAGSFPKDLGYPMRANNTYELPRLEWIKWKSEIISGVSTLPISPRFGDYTVQHPFFSEPVHFPNVSASIRYTCSDYWLVLRGEALGKDGGQGAAQYPAEAQLIVDRQDYSGESFSFGDKSIMNKTKDENHPGNPRQWLTIAINHHMSYVVYQLNPELNIQRQKEDVQFDKSIHRVTLPETNNVVSHTSQSINIK